MQLYSVKLMAKVPVSPSRQRCVCQISEERCFWDGDNVLSKRGKALMPVQDLDIFVQIFTF